MVLPDQKQTKREGPRAQEESVSLRMDAKLAQTLKDLGWRRRTDRTKEIVKACEFYVSAITCPSCGALNCQIANYCSVCSTPLSDVAKENERCKDLLLTILQEDEKYLDVMKHIEEIAKVSKCSSGADREMDKIQEWTTTRKNRRLR